MKVEIEVKRVRMSATQGEAKVYINGHYVSNFADKIELIQEGEAYFGENVGGWASKKPDTDFIRGVLCHPYEEAYHIHEKIGSILDVVEAEERGADELERLRKKQTMYVMTCGLFYNGFVLVPCLFDFILSRPGKAFGHCKPCKINRYDRICESIVAGTQSVYTEYTGEEPVRNFACDFAVPVKDELLEEMIRDWNADSSLPKKWPDAAKATDRVEEIGGINFIWY